MGLEEDLKSDIWNLKEARISIEKEIEILKRDQDLDQKKFSENKVIIDNMIVKLNDLIDKYSKAVMYLDIISNTSRWALRIVVVLLTVIGVWKNKTGIWEALKMTVSAIQTLM